MRLRQLLVVGAASAVVVGTGGYAYAQSRDSAPSYSTALASISDVERTLNLSGTVSASGRRDLSFGTTGKVASVAVKAGAQVKAGQALASLETARLDAAVTQAAATLARAQAQLESDQDAQTSAVTTPISPSTPSTQSQSKPRTQSQQPQTQQPQTQQPQTQQPQQNQPSTPSVDVKALQEQQAAVRYAQSAATEAITAAKAALAAQTEACKVSAPTAQAIETPDPGLSEACTTALAGVQDAQEVVAAKQDTLQTALNALGETLTKAVATSTKPVSARTAATAASVTVASEPTVAIEPTTPQSSSRDVPTAANIASDQAEIDTAEAQLAQAQVARKAVALTAPFAGRVLEVGVAKGDSVTTGTTAFVLQGKGVTTVTTSVTATQISQLKIGQTARVTPAGWTEPLTGKVTSIGMLPSSSAESTTYPVTVTLATTESIPEGAGASVAVVTGLAADAVTVPTSAVRNLGRTTVTVLDQGVATTTVVTVGIVGPTRTSITDGLNAGQRVVLADLDEPLPSATEGQQNNGGLGGGGGFTPNRGTGPSDRVVVRPAG